MNTWDVDAALERFNKVASEYVEVDLTEADTRSKIIDSMLISVLGWDEKNILREEHVRDSGTYLDYKLCTIRPHIIIEAKKSSIDFELPISDSKREYKIGGVLKQCSDLFSAMRQAKNYADSKGISYCVVTNGYQYIFFRSNNAVGIEWVDQKAIVFRDLEDISNNFDLFASLLSKSSVEQGALSKLLVVKDDDYVESDRFKTLDTTHLQRPRTKDRNSLFPYFGEVIHRVFQDLGSENSESEVLENCYVNSPNKRGNMPYLDRDANLLDVSKGDAGDFQKRVYASLSSRSSTDKEVILLIGSVGVGKSTFIQRFRKVLLNEKIDESGIWLYLNFLKFSDTGETLDEFVCNQIDDHISSEYSDYGLDDWQFIKQIYHKEYEKLKRGSLAPVFNKSPDDFDIEFSKYIQGVMSENRVQHFIRLLSTASKRLNKSVFLVFDNADQLSPDTQNSIFLLAQKLSDSIKCYSLISLREESYWKNRDSGPLNAFHTTAYHVQPPKLEQVLSKRFVYSKKLIETRSREIFTENKVSSNDLIGVFDRLVQTVLGDDRRYIEFIEAISSRDNRRALDITAYFMISGHTNIDAILRDVKRGKNSKGLVIPFHEFITSIILKDHENFNEALCEVINIFNTDGDIDASNFNRLAVLGRILKARGSKSEVGSGYLLIDSLVADCAIAGIKEETTLAVLSLLNSKRLVETETQIKDSLEYSKYVRTTASGEYYVDKLSQDFGYLDLVLTSTPIGNDKFYKDLNKLNGEINALQDSLPSTRLKRVEKRLERTSIFIDYLHSEFQKSSIRRHKELFDESVINLMLKIRDSFGIEKEEVLTRAKRIFGL